MATSTTGRRARGRAAARRSDEGAASGGIAASNGDGAAHGQRAADEAVLEDLLQTLKAARAGDFSARLNTRRRDLLGEIAAELNELVATNQRMAKELVRVGRIIGREGRMTERAALADARGAWATSIDSVNALIDDLVRPTTEVARVIVAVAEGDLSQKMALKIEGQPVKGEFLRIGTTVNTMVDQLSSFADEVTRVAREVGTEGKLGGQAKVKGVSGTWKDLTDSVNLMASNLTDQVRNIAQVTTAVAQGDLSQQITVDVKGEILELKNTINTMVDQLSSFADEVTRVAREVGTEGKLGGQAEVKGVSGTWRGLTESVNFMANNLTDQVRNIAQVTTAVAQGDLSQKITVDVKGEILELKDTINTMVDQLRSFADEVTRVAREVGTEGKLGGQAEVEGVSGTWRGLTENVNQLAGNLTTQVRNIAQVTTAVAQGDLSQKITVDAEGEILELKDTINTMVDQLSSFADEVTRVAREVGTEGKLGGQAEVEGVSGTWRGLTENVNQLAGNLTTQVRSIAEVSTAVTQGDLTRSISVEAQGEVAELKDNINQMIANLRDTTKRNEEQDWLKTNLARISGLMQGQRELRTVTQLIMSELTPTVSAQHGAFFLAGPADEEDPGPCLRLIASYGYQPRKDVPTTFAFGEGLVGQAAVERKSILVEDVPPSYIRIASGLGGVRPANIIVMPILFEERVLGVIELASLQPYSEIHRTFLEQLMETLGVVLNTITANMRTEQLLQQSQSLTQELQTQSEELQQKAALLEERNRDIETKNREIEFARLGLEEKAAQLALSSKYKSEFLANMSHELRTPLNSLLVLSKLLLENEAGNLSDKQLEFARTIHTAGIDLLQLISDILDLSKIEAGKMEILPDLVGLADVQAYVTRTFDPIAADKGLGFEIRADTGLPETILTDEQRLEQILRNLLSNAFKFTESGGVTLSVTLRPDERVAFAVSDTGVGIAPDKLRVIFEAFQQADGTTSRKYGGTGLGLSISRELARALGGEIEVFSAVGQGSTFTLILPLTHPRPLGFSLEPRSESDGLSEGAFASAADPSGPAALASDAVAIANSNSAAVGAPGPAGAPAPALIQAGSEAPVRRVLVVERGSAAAEAIAGLAGNGDGVVTVRAAAAAEAEAALAGPPFDCVVLGRGIAKTAAFGLLERIAAEGRLQGTVCVLCPDRALTAREQSRLRRLAPAIATSVVESPEQLVAEAAMALHRQTARRPSGGWSAELARSDNGQHVAAALHGRKVLLVDDDVRNLFALASLLEDRGMEVVFGETGHEALAALERHRDVEIVLMDIMMPGMDGNETIAAIRQLPGLGELPIIAVTAKAMEGDRERSLSAGASDYITKPVEPERLLMLIGTWLQP
jgi:signal transduction histidine kinase/HAMP domain-containing protein/CheY-like chemotaxis protein